jgi:Permeases of the drug/metabolite transporter (DMT) superfamily
MNKAKIYPILQALLAALLFGLSTPLSKLLLGQIEPIPLAAFLYIGSGTGLLLLKALQYIAGNRTKNEAPLSVRDIPWLSGAILFGGIIAPIVLMLSLKKTPASTAALLLNFEGAGTAIIAYFLFKESIGKRVWIAIGCVTTASILLSYDFSNQWGFSLGALGIICACFCWGIDNNFTRNISLKDPISIVLIKGFGAGFFSLFLSLMLKDPLPDFKTMLIAMLLGFFSYGISIVLYVLALRSLGSSRTSVFFGTAPFIGAALSFIICHDALNIMMIISLPIMVGGAILLLREDHVHKHIHQPIVHEHRHNHFDGHHNHTHLPGEIPSNGYHSHMHTHEFMEHEHPHNPDMHHRHSHINGSV